MAVAMKFVFIVCLGLAWSGSSEKLSARAKVGSPLEKVVNLLREMEAQLQSDHKVEEQTYNKYACWCEKASNLKATAIESAQAQIRSLGQTILQTKGEIETLTARIAELEKLIEENLKAQEEATAIRRKQNEEYLAVTAETKQALVALEKAITTLIVGATNNTRDLTGEFEAQKAAYEEPALLQQGKGRALVQTVVESLPSKIVLTANQMSLLSEFMSSDSRSKYTPQSSSVQGILKDMYATFAKDVESATKTEAVQNFDFEDYIAVQIEKLNAMKDEKTLREGQKADKEATLADTEQLYDDVEAQMQADIKFFDETKKACEEKHDQWVLRSKLRAEELKGVQEAVEMLSTDEARALFASTIKAGKETDMKEYDTGVDIYGKHFQPPALVQVGQRLWGAAPQLRAYEALKAKASRVHSLRLASLAARVHEAKAGHFDEVIASIDATIKVLKEEETADIAKRDQCKEEITQANSTILNLTWAIKCNQAKIDKLANKIAELTEEKEATNAEIQATIEFKNQITQVRLEEHGVFNQSKSDDTAAINLLVEVRDVLAEYYDNNTIAMGPLQGGVKGLALQQQSPDFEVSQFEAPDATFSNKGSRKNEAKGILQILTMVIEDLNDEIANDMKQEEAAQLTYEAQHKAAEELEAKLGEKVVFLDGEIARINEEKAEETADMNQNLTLLGDEQAYLDKITPDCKWILKAFSERDEKREAEMGGLVAAKEYLVGYQPDAALAQLHGHFDDESLSKIHFGLRR